MGDSRSSKLLQSKGLVAFDWNGVLSAYCGAANCPAVKAILKHSTTSKVVCFSLPL